MEVRELPLEDAETAVAALRTMPQRPQMALDVLLDLCQRQGLSR